VSTRPSDKLYPIEEHPTFRGAFDEVKGEVREFLATRITLLRSEMQQKVSAYKAGIPLIVGGALLLIASFVALNIAILALLAHAFGDSALAWGYSALVLFVLYAALGAGLAFLGMREVRRTGLVPTHTLKVLKQDQDWIQREAKTQV
jgi:hypothetical protein